MNLPEMLDALDAALAEARDRRLRGDDEALRLTGPYGAILDAEGRRVAVEDGRSVWGFTLAQVQGMSDRLREAIRDEAGLPPATDRRRA